MYYNFLNQLGHWVSYGLDYRGSIPGKGGDCFSFPPSPCRLWGPPNLLSNGYRILFYRG